MKNLTLKQVASIKSITDEQLNDTIHALSSQILIANGLPVSSMNDKSKMVALFKYIELNYRFDIVETDNLKHIFAMPK